MEDQGQARDEGIDRAARANALWRLNAESVLLEVARSLATLTSDDVWAALRRRGIPPPSEPRAMGAVMRHGESEQWVRRTEATRISPDPSTPNHRRPQRVYESLVLGRQAETQPPAAAAVSVDPAGSGGTEEGLFEVVEEPVKPVLRASDYACGKVETVKGGKESCLRPLTDVYETRFDARYVEGNCPKHGRVFGSLLKPDGLPMGWGNDARPAPKTTKPKPYRKRKKG